MKKLSARTRIVLGQIAMLVSVLMMAVAFGFVPSTRDAILQGRGALCESVAISTSILATRNDTTGLDAELRAVVARNGDILSAAIRKADKKLLVEVGDHENNWLKRGNDAIDSFVEVPIRANDAPWGNVEFRFRPLARNGLVGMLQTPAWKLVCFVAACCFIVFWLYLRKMLQHMDPSKVVPGRVRSALDTLTEGLLVLDPTNRVMLATQAFATLVGKDPDAPHRTKG